MTGNKKAKPERPLRDSTATPEREQMQARISGLLSRLDDNDTQEVMTWLSLYVESRP